jgi:hypothetical protein
MSQSGRVPRSGLSPERLRRLHRNLQGYIERGEIAGIVALIHRHGEEAHVETLGWQDKACLCSSIACRGRNHGPIQSALRPLPSLSHGYAQANG